MEFIKFRIDLGGRRIHLILNKTRNPETMSVRTFFSRHISDRGKRQSFSLWSKGVTLRDCLTKMLTPRQTGRKVVGLDESVG